MAPRRAQGTKAKAGRREKDALNPKAACKAVVPLIQAKVRNAKKEARAMEREIINDLRREVECFLMQLRPEIQRMPIRELLENHQGDFVRATAELERSALQPIADAQKRGRRGRPPASVMAPPPSRVTRGALARSSVAIAGAECTPAIMTRRRNAEMAYATGGVQGAPATAIMRKTCAKARPARRPPRGRKRAEPESESEGAGTVETVLLATGDGLHEYEVGLDGSGLERIRDDHVPEVLAALKQAKEQLEAEQRQRAHFSSIYDSIHSILCQRGGDAPPA